jgi:general secretion pathway protein N
MNRRLVYLLATMALLGGYAAWSQSGALMALIAPAQQQAAASAKTQTAAKSNPPAALNPLDGLSEQTVAAIVERPLFAQSRRPPAPPPPAPEPPPAAEPEVAAAPEGPTLSAGDFTLLAVSSAGERKVAVIRVNASNEVMYLREEQPLLEWRVLTVGTRDVKIGDDNEQVTIKMFDKPQAAEMPEDVEEADTAEPPAAAEQGEQPVPPMKPKGTVFHPDAGRVMKPPGAMPQSEGGG